MTVDTTSKHGKALASAILAEAGDVLRTAQEFDVAAFRQ